MFSFFFRLFFFNFLNFPTVKKYHSSLKKIRYSNGLVYSHKFDPISQVYSEITGVWGTNIGQCHSECLYTAVDDPSG